ncbi:MAG: GGDEF domain-containing protein, partial [Candidatus Omnitrophica bacterium]|nr:GGDEF domain-containing protein [Candidatus Omnitrophota bacterium]
MREDRRKKQLHIEAKEAVQELIYQDDLTKLHNRRYLNKCLGEIIEKADGEKYLLSLFMIDVDKFKEINDTYGHLRGDKVLIEVADLLRESFREYDEIIRYAGDEFIVILPMATEGDALKIAGRLIGKISQYVFAGEGGQRDLSLTLSLGIALYPRDAKEAEKLIYRADEALYLSKRSGRNKVSIFTQVPEDILNKDKVFELLSFEIIGKEKHLKRIKEII